MNAVASLAFGIVTSVAGAAASVASIVMAEPETHQLADLSAPDLWTIGPVRVNPGKQNYQRVAPVYSSYVTQAPKINLASRKPDPALIAIAEEKPTVSAEHFAWCSQRYRSYDPATNSYRAFSGEMRSCASPYSEQTSKSRVSMTQAAATPAPGVAESQAAASWCAERYQSYDAEDNSYQPFDGPRRQCRPPLQQDLVTATD
jgi:hypothetical protein